MDYPSKILIMVDLYSEFHTLSWRADGWKCNKEKTMLRSTLLRSTLGQRLLLGTFIIAAISLLRYGKVLQIQEWMAFDALLRVRPQEETVDDRIVIVGINEADIDRVGGFPIDDADLAQAITNLATHNPRAIGLDIYKNVSNSPGQQTLEQVLRQTPNVVGVTTVFSMEPELNVPPPPMLPPERVGFIDFVEDEDLQLRRGLLLGRDWEGTLHYSFALRLAQLYLDTEGYTLQPQGSSQDPIQFAPEFAPEFAPGEEGENRVALPRFQPNTGGYVRADANGNQILVNFSVHPRPFRVISLSQVLDQTVDPHWITDRIVMIGAVAPSAKDTFITSAVVNTIISEAHGSPNASHHFITGIEFHAHVVHQILGTVLDRRRSWRSWPEALEYGWIVIWGSLGLGLGWLVHSPWKGLLGWLGGTIGLFLCCYGGLLLGWWIPLVPPGLSFSATTLLTLFLDRKLHLEIEQRRRAIEQTYEAVHNGPLQHLAVLLRHLGEAGQLGEAKQSSETGRSGDTGQSVLTPKILYDRLQTLNQELRHIYETMRQEANLSSTHLYISGIQSSGQPLALDQANIADLLYQVYDCTLDRDFPSFQTILTYIPPDFSPLQGYSLNLEQKRNLCLWLEEALCNVGKHAMQPTRLDVVCQHQAGWYYLRVVDNGQNQRINPGNSKGDSQGTRQAQQLARQLRGRFQRYGQEPKGMVCELRWPERRQWFRR
jgi:CHASE2 domain-containing sensor protein